jgi:hypothetical protein
MMSEYPDWICSPCGHEHGDERPLLATYHTGECGWCGNEDIPVTSPRDYGYPDAPKVRRGRGLGKKPAMRHITIRVPQHVVNHFNGDTRAMRDAWVKHTEEKINAEAPE